MASSNIPASAAAPPNVDTRLRPPPRAEVWIGYCRLGLVLTGACYMLMGMAFVPFIALVGDGAALALGAVVFAFTVGFGVLNVVAARGLKNGSRWAWILSLVLAAMYTSSACLPVGVALLVGLLRQDVRRIFLD